MAAQSGLVTLPALGAFAKVSGVRPVLRRFGFRMTLAVNGVLAALGVAICAAFTPAWPLGAVFLVLAAGGLARSLHFTALNTLSFADVPPAKLSAATAMSGTVQQLGVGLGVVLGSLVLEVTRMAAGRAEATAGDFSVAFLVAGLVVLGAVPGALRLPADAGARVSGHRP